MRILIATVTAGGGHLAAAAALEEAWRAASPNDTIQQWDLLDSFSALHRKVYSEGYLRLAEHAPEIWGMVFKSTDKPGLARRLSKLRQAFPTQSRVRLRRKLRQFAPGVVLCTHYLPLEILGDLEEKEARSRRAAFAPFVASIVTDFEAHALWMNSCVDLYCVANEATGARLKARGASPESIVTTGIPIASRFSQPVNGPEVRKRMGLRDDLPIILVLSGGFGMGPVAEIVRELDKAGVDFQVVVVTGRNQELRRDLASADRVHPTHVLGFTNRMHELMATSSLIITKPGGLTTSEALASARPLLIINPIPGQEAANSDFLLERGAAVKVNRVEDLPYRLVDLFKEKRLPIMSRAAKALGRPNAAADICKAVKERATVGT